METHTAFFYGTLMAESVLYRVVFGTPTPDPYQRDSLQFRSAVLSGFCRHRVRDADYPAIIPQRGATVRGTIVTGLTTMQLNRLDTFEGSEYERVLLDSTATHMLQEDRDASTVSGPASEAVASNDLGKVQTYVWRSDPEDLEAREWDFEEFQRERMRFWAGEREEYDEIAAEEAKGSYRDPMGGRGPGGVLGMQLEDEGALRAAV